jgi:hypothetical protein
MHPPLRLSSSHSPSMMSSCHLSASPSPSAEAGPLSALPVSAGLPAVAAASGSVAAATDPVHVMCSR